MVTLVEELAKIPNNKVADLVTIQHLYAFALNRYVSQENRPVCLLCVAILSVNSQKHCVFQDNLKQNSALLFSFFYGKACLKTTYLSQCSLDQCKLCLIVEISKILKLITSKLYVIVSACDSYIGLNLFSVFPEETMVEIETKLWL